MALRTIISVLKINSKDIDHDLARGTLSNNKRYKDTTWLSHVSGLVSLLKDYRLLIFAFCVVLFHFANAAMLPLVGQYLSLGKAKDSPLYMSACIIVAQLVMIPVSSWAGREASQRGHKAIFLIGFAVLPIRGLLYTLSSNPYYLIGVQLLDGIGAGIFGLLSVLMIADLIKGTGRFNLVQGAISTATAIGASLSNILAGIIVEQAGYQAGFLFLAGMATIAVVVFALLMPETQSSSVKSYGN